jgi:hypothetical protein
LAAGWVAQRKLWGVLLHRIRLLRRTLGMGKLLRLGLLSWRRRRLWILLPVLLVLGLAGLCCASGRVVNPVAAARNLIKGEQVIVHGTAKKITGSMLKGVAGEVDDTTKVVFGWNPRQPFSKDFVPQRARSFATGTAYGKPDLQNSQRNVVIARVKKSDTFAHQGGLENEAVITAGNARISSVIKAPPPNASRAEIAAYSKSLANEVRKAGSRLRGADRLSELQQRIELAKYSKSLKKVPKKK